MTETPGEHDGASAAYRFARAPGGMGEVWLAEQARLVQRQVALKVIKAGKDTAQVVAGSTPSVRRWRSWTIQPSRVFSTEEPHRRA